MMRKILFFVIALVMMTLPLQAAQRELVVKLKNGSMKAYHLTSDFKNIVTMKSTGEAITLNGDEYAIADIVELRIYEEVPEGADVIDAIRDINDEQVAGHIVPLTGYDLSGRQVTTSSMKSGVYIINRKKVLIP